MSFSEIVENASDHSEAKQKNFNLKPITPEGIFSFACHPGVSCFNRCCHEIDVILTPVDILKMKTELNMSSDKFLTQYTTCLLYTSPSPRDGLLSRMPSSA